MGNFRLARPMLVNDVDYYIHGPVRNYFLDQYVTMYIGDKMYKDGALKTASKLETQDIKTNSDKKIYFHYKTKNYLLQRQ